MPAASTTFSAPPSEPVRTSRGHRFASPSLLGLAISIFALVLHFMRFGYAYGSGDQDETLSLVLHRLDSTLFSGDWFISTQAGEPGVRTAFVWTIATLADVIPLWLAVLFVHVATFVAIALAIHRLTQAFVSSESAALVAPLAALVLTPQWTLGGNDVVHSILAPSSVAWSFALWSLIAAIGRRHVLAGILIGIATLFQALVGLQVAAVLFTYLVTRANHRWFERLRTTALSGLCFAVVSAPLLVPLILKQTVPVPADDTAPSVLYILAVFRAPHHYLPLSYPVASYVKFGALLVVGAGSFLWLRRRGALRHADFLFAGLNVLSVFLVLGFLLTETVPLLTVVKLQPFKLTVLAKPVLIAGVAGLLFRVTPWGRRADRHLLERRHQVATILMATAAGLLLFVGLSDTALQRRVHPVAHARSNLGMVERWARDFTDERATFLVPPSNTTFRITAKRGIVVNFKSIPFEPDLLRTWFRRLLSVAPIALPAAGGAPVQAALDAAYTAQSPSRLADLASQFGASYILIEREITAPEHLQEVFAADEWRVYTPVEAAGPHLTLADSTYADAAP